MEKPMRQALVTLGQLVDWEVLAERLPLSGNPWFPAPTKSRPQLAPTVQSRDRLPLPDMGGGPGRFLCPVARYGAGKRKRQEDKKEKRSKPRSFPSPTINKGGCLASQDVKAVL